MILQSTDAIVAFQKGRAIKQSALLSVASLTVKFGGLTALSNIHLDLHPGEVATNGISRTLQGRGLYRDLTVLENVMVGATVNKTTGLIAALLGRDRNAEVAFRGKAEHAHEQTIAHH